MNEAKDNAEVWKDIKGYEGRYQISNYGRVWSVVSNRIIGGCVDKAGYHIVCLHNQYHKAKNEKVHRLVALHFCEKPEGCNVVNHLDGNKLNNHYTNLEWTTTLGNNRHALEKGLKVITEKDKARCRLMRAFKTYVIDSETGELLGVYKSGKQCAKAIGCDNHTVSKYANSGKPYQGMVIEYASN